MSHISDIGTDEACAFPSKAGDAMKKVKPVAARNAKELAKALGLTAADAVEFEIRSALNDKINDKIIEV